MAGLLINALRWFHSACIFKTAQGDGDEIGPKFRYPIDGRSTDGAEAELQALPAISGPHVGLVFSRRSNLIGFIKYRDTER